MSIRSDFRVMLTWLLSVFLLATTPAARAAELNISPVPLFLGSKVDPNVFFMMDDSGSMDWEIATHKYNYYYDYWNEGSQYGIVDSGKLRSYSNAGSCTGARHYTYLFDSDVNTDNAYDSCSYPAIEDMTQAGVRDWRVFSSDLNIMFYNPSITYQPWLGFPAADFFNARSNPQPDTTGYTLLRDLTGFSYEVWDDTLGYEGDDDGDKVGGPESATQGANGQVDLWDSHTRYVVGATDVNSHAFDTDWATISTDNNVCALDDAQDDPPYKDCFGTTELHTTLAGTAEDQWGRTAAQIRQNIANWYQYHRRRSFVAKHAITQVIIANSTFRFGYSQINDYEAIFREVPGAEVTDYTTHNAELLQAMYDYEQEPQGTPLRRGLERVGRYYSNYYEQYDDPIRSSCQQNYSVLFSDGFWNGSSAHTDAIGDEDGDGASDTLADVAHYFYNEDLSPLPNNVPTTPMDLNKKQHMVSFTVAFGVEGNLTDTDGDRYPNPELDEDGNWTNGAVDTDPEKIDDLWHAAFNSKAFFVQAQTPEGIASAITSAVLEISERVGASASVATNSGSLNAGSHLFQARFNSSGWNGELLAYAINLDGSLEEEPTWEAGGQLGDQDFDTGREIITYRPATIDEYGNPIAGSGIPFRFPSLYTSPAGNQELSEEQISDLLTDAPFAVDTEETTEIAANQDFGIDVVNYLRGDTSNEGQGQNFRDRTVILGDVVHSDPKYVGRPRGQYPDDMEAASYAAFRNSHSERPGVVYVGANDGMVHAFLESDGSEVLAYVPSEAYENLYRLTRHDYTHRYYVDSGPNIVDVYLDGAAPGGAWRTVLAGGLGAGGQGIYALDVTDPDEFDEANAAELSLWEFTDADDADLGYTFSQPQLVRLANGKWAAIFGNGYNNTEEDGHASTTGHAVLFIVDAETGELIKKIDTQKGSADTPNGLATPLVIDQDSDFIADYVYAGDLQGNMWKFDITATNPSNWGVAYEKFGAPHALFTTEENQPITSQPQATLHPDLLGGFMIFFGTGKYMEIGDGVSYGQSTQAFYGVWDKNKPTLTTFDSADLLSQTITNQYTQNFDTDGDEYEDTSYKLRDVSDNAIDYGEHMGWKLNLLPTKIDGFTNTQNFGERQVSTPIVRNGRIIFTTLLPSTEECTFGGSSFLMELSYRDGSSLGYPPFDLNNDGLYDAMDGTASGRSSDVGIMPTVSLLADRAEDIAFGSGASGDIDIIQLNVGGDAYGRQSWREVE